MANRFTTKDLLMLTAKAAAAVCFLILLFAPTVAQAEGFEVEPVCPEAEPGYFECFALEIPLGEEPQVEEETEEELEEELEGSGELGGLSPADLASAYKLNTEAGEGQTIAIVNAFDDPNAESDLAVYRETYGLPACTTGNGCFSKLNQKGEKGNYPTANAGWAGEISLDLDMVSAVCPRCHIVLVEADNNISNSLDAAEDLAASLKPAAISDSWGSVEQEGDFEEDGHFNHPGIPITVSSGDAGYRVGFPASSRYVIAVGGTTLRKDAGTRGWAEEAWLKAGSGCSLYEPKPSWQKDTGCANRLTADVSAVANPATGVSVYDTYKKAGWLVFGGTSASAPIIAGVEALSSKTVREEGAKAFYDGAAGALFDPAGAANGYCAPPAEHRYYCTALLGFDGPTGNGSPDLTPGKAPLVASAAANVQAEGAELIGTVNPQGSETHYSFEWGTSTAYGNSAPAKEESAGSGSSGVHVSAAIGGLKPETTYHFRLRATNASGTTYGEDRHLFTRGPGWAAEPEYLTSYGGPGSENGKLSNPSSVVVSPVTGNVFVVEGTPNRRVQVFSPEGKFIRKFTFEGVESSVYSLAIDKHGHLWVSDLYSPRVQEFTEEGSAIGSFEITGYGSEPKPIGVAVDGSGNVWVALREKEEVVKYSETGAKACEFAVGQLPYGITVDEQGNVWTANGNAKSGAKRVEEHSGECKFLKSLGDNNRPSDFNRHNVFGEFRSGASTGLAVDPGGNVWVTSFNSAVVVGQPREFFAETLVYSSAGNYEESFGSQGVEGGHFYHPWGLGLDPRGYVWITDTSTDRLMKWKIPALGHLSATTEAATEVSAAGATLKGSVNPGGFAATYKFEYGKTTSYGSTAPAGGGGLDPGYSTTKLSQQISSLEPNTTYHYRLSATGLETVHGEDKTFTTPRAFNPPTYVSSFGVYGTENGQFVEPWGDVVDSSGNLWVVDKGNSRVQKFNSKGEFLCKIGSNGSGNGQFVNPHGIAADSSGDVWVADSGNNRLQKIGPLCEYLSQFGSKGSGNGQLQSPVDTAIDPSGHLWVSDRANYRIEEFTAKGEFMAKCGTQGSEPGQFKDLWAIEADADGNVWAGDEESGGYGAQEFNSKCEFVAGFNAASSGALGGVSPKAMAIDASGNIWTANESGGYVSVFHPEGEYVTRFGEAGSGAGQFSRASGLAFAPDGTLWLVDEAHNRVEKWAPGAPYPVETGRAALVNRTEATLKGSVNPGGTATSYQFEYGTSPTFGSVAPASPKAIGSGSTPVAVSEALSGLKAGTTYYYHLVATSEKGTTYGELRHFKTLPAAGAGAVTRIAGKKFSELGISEAAFTLSGSFKMEFTASGNLVTYNCTESGSGTLVSAGLKQESVTLNCTLSGAPECKVEPITFKVDSSFHPEGIYLFNIVAHGKGCWFGESTISVANSSGFFEFGSEAVSMNVNSRATATAAGWQGTLTGNSKWSLNGANTGKTLGFF